MNEEGAVCLGSDVGAKKRKRGADSSLKPASTRSEKERERGASSGQGHAEKAGGGRHGREVDRHGMDVAALGCSDSVGSTRLTGAAGVGCEQERRRARVTDVWAADRRGRAATGPGGQRRDAGGREQE
jgi:hypothetical protein